MGVELAIEAVGLEKSFGQTRALAGLDLAVPTGTILGVLGPNGSGKTTAVRVLTTLLRSDRGTARVAGYDVVSQATQVRRRIGLAGQSAALDESLTGSANLVMIGQLCRLPRRRAQQRAEELLSRFDLADAKDRGVKDYSGGMRRRLDLAASLVSRPPILFLDEPTTGLDPRSRLVLWDIIRTLVADGTTVLLTTQYLEEADQLAHRIVVIDAGSVIAQGTSDELKAHVVTASRSPWHPSPISALRATYLPAMPRVGSTSTRDDEWLTHPCRRGRGPFRPSQPRWARRAW